MIRFCDEAVALRDGYPDFYYFKAKAHGAVGELQEAVDAYRRYLEIVRDFAGSEVSKDTSVSHYSPRTKPTTPGEIWSPSPPARQL